MKKNKENYQIIVKQRIFCAFRRLSGRKIRIYWIFENPVYGISASGISMPLSV